MPLNPLKACFLKVTQYLQIRSEFYISSLSPPLVLCHFPVCRFSVFHFSVVVMAMSELNGLKARRLFLSLAEWLPPLSGLFFLLSVSAFIKHNKFACQHTKPVRTQLVCFCREITANAEAKGKQISSCLTMHITVELKAANYEDINCTHVSVIVFTVTYQSSFM